MNVFLYARTDDGGTRDGLLARCPRQPAQVSGRLWRLPGGRLVLDLEGEGEVGGTLVGPVPEAALGLLDLLEGVPEGRIRRVDVHVRARGRMVPAWTWVAVAPGNLGGRPIRRAAGR